MLNRPLTLRGARAIKVVLGGKILLGEVEAWQVQECHKERKMVKIRAQNSILFVHAPRSASA